MDAGHHPRDIDAMPWSDVQVYLAVKFGHEERRLGGGD